jgi:hypothetical protein
VIRRALRLMVRLGLLVGAALVISKVVQGRREETNGPGPSSGPGGSPLTYGSGASVREAPQPVAPKAQGPVIEAPPKPAPAKAEPGAVDLPGDVVVGRSEAPPQEPWVEPDVAGLCPSSHPVKAKLSSGIFHLPGMLAYTRTRADRCYCDEETAQADGLRKSKR